MHLKRKFISKIRATSKNLKFLGIFPARPNWREHIVYQNYDDSIIAKLELYDGHKNNPNPRRRKKKKVKNKVNGFYQSREWRELRVRVIEWHEGKCAMCGRTHKEHGVVIHIDHIKPRSKYPELELRFDNLQILCEDCNLGKSNKYETDWRPKISSAEKELDNEYLVNINIYN